MKTMNFKIHKTSGGVIHSGSWMGNEADPKTSKYGYFTPSCGSGVVYAPSTNRNVAGFREAKADAEVTCRKCLKLAAKLEAERVQAEATEARREQAKAALKSNRVTMNQPPVQQTAAVVSETVFVCLGCGTNNRNDKCLSGDAYHPAGREMTREAYEQYKAERRPAVTDEHTAAVARMRANIDAEEEERAAARRARNRTNYGTTSHPVGRKLAKDHGLNFF